MEEVLYRLGELEKSDEVEEHVMSGALASSLTRSNDGDEVGSSFDGRYDHNGSEEGVSAVYR